MGSKTKGQSAPLSDSQRPVLAVQPERLRELSSTISTMGFEAGMLADLLEMKVNTSDNGEDLSGHLYFAAQALKRLQQGLSDAEGHITTLDRKDIDLAEFVRWVKVGPS
jgi:hypothetical protein